MKMQGLFRLLMSVGLFQALRSDTEFCTGDVIEKSSGFLIVLRMAIGGVVNPPEPAYAWWHQFCV
jgi:hypothetical protein